MNENEQNVQNDNVEPIAPQTEPSVSPVTENIESAASSEPSPHVQTDNSSGGCNDGNGGNNGYSWDNNSYNEKKRKKGRNLAIILVAATLVVALLSFCAGLAVNGGNGNNIFEVSYPEDEYVYTESSASDDSSRPSAPQIITPSTEVPEYTTELTELYDKCAVSCATIYVASKSGYSIGSGFVVSEDGYVITNHHVIEGGTDISVIFYNGESYEAEVIGSDQYSDIAVLRIDAEGLVPIEIGNSDSLKIGDAVFAIGTPYSMELAGTMTTGVISGVQRKISVTNSYGSASKTMTLIQTDSSINPGNSGGPLINMAGQVVGINFLKISSYESLGFAIPITNALTIINDLISYGEVNDYDNDFVKVTPKLNISVVTVEAVREQYNIPDDAPDGCMVTQLYRSSAVYKAGLELYDIITEFNGVTVTGNADLSEALSQCRAGQSVTMKVYRLSRDGSGKEYTLSFVLEAAS